MGTNFDSMDTINTAPKPLEIKDFKPEKTSENKVLSKKNEILHSLRWIKNASAKLTIFQDHVTGQKLT